MRTNLGLVDKFSAKETREYDFRVLQSGKPLNPVLVSKMKALLQEYKSFKKGIRKNLKNSYTNIDSFISYLRKECENEISSSHSDLADYAIEVTYGDEVSMVEFAWKMFPEGIIENLLETNNGIVRMPVPDNSGEITYLWNTYSIKEFDVKDVYED